jgi:hypothetical protein
MTLGHESPMKIKQRLLFVGFAIAAVENEHLLNLQDGKLIAMVKAQVTPKSIQTTYFHRLLFFLRAGMFAVLTLT